MKNIIVKKLKEKGLDNKSIIENIIYEMGQWIGMDEYIDAFKTNKDKVKKKDVNFVIILSSLDDNKYWFTCENDIYYKEIFNIIKTIDNNVIEEFLYKESFNWAKELEIETDNAMEYIEKFKKLEYVDGQPWKLSNDIRIINKIVKE